MDIVIYITINILLYIICNIDIKINIYDNRGAHFWSLS